MAHDSRHPDIVQNGLTALGYNVGDDSLIDFDGWAYNSIGSDNADDTLRGSTNRVIQLVSEATDIPGSANPFITNHAHWSHQVNNSSVAYLDENTNSIKLKPMYMHNHVSVDMDQFNWLEIQCPDGFVNNIVSVTPFSFMHQIMIVYEGGSTSSERSGYAVLYTFDAKLGEMDGRNDSDRPPGETHHQKLWDDSTISIGSTPHVAWTWTGFGSGSGVSGRAICVARKRNDDLWVLEYLVLYPNQNQPHSPFHDTFELFNAGEEVLASYHSRFSFLTNDNGVHKNVSFSNDSTTIHSRSDTEFNDTYSIDNIATQWNYPFPFISEDGSSSVSVLSPGFFGEHTVDIHDASMIGVQGIDATRIGNRGTVVIVFEDGKAFHLGVVDDTFNVSTETGAAGYTELYQLIESPDAIVSGIFAEHPIATFLVKRGNTWYYEAYTSTHEPLNEKSIGFYNLFGDIQIWEKDNLLYKGHSQGDLPSGNFEDRTPAGVALGRFWFFNDEGNYGSLALVGGNLLFDRTEANHYHSRFFNNLGYICSVFQGMDEIQGQDNSWFSEQLAFIFDPLSILALDDERLLIVVWSIEVSDDPSFSDMKVGSFIIATQDEDNPALLKVVDIPGLFESYDDRPWDRVAGIAQKHPDGSIWVADGDQTFGFTGKVWKLDNDWYPTTSITCTLPDSQDDLLMAFGMHPERGTIFFGALYSLYEFDTDGNFIEMYRWVDVGGSFITAGPFTGLPTNRFGNHDEVYFEGDTDWIQRIHFDGDYAYLFVDGTQNLYKDGGLGILRVNINASDPTQRTPENYFARSGPENFWFGSMGGSGFGSLAGLQETVQPYFGVKQVATLIWVVDRDSGTVRGLNASSGDQTNSLTLSEAQPWGLGYSVAEQAGSLWMTDEVASKGQEGLSIREIATGNTIRQIPSPGNTPRGIAWSGNRVSIQEVVEEFITLLWIGDDITTDHERRTSNLETAELGPLMVFEDISPFHQPTWSALAPDGTFWAWSLKTSPTEYRAFHFASDFSLIESFPIENISDWRAMAFTPEGDWWHIGRDSGMGILRQRSTTDGSTITNHTFTDILFEGVTWGDGYFWATAYDPDGNGFIHQISEDGIIQNSFQPEGGTEEPFAIAAIAWGGNKSLLYHRYVESETEHFRFFRVSTVDGTLIESISLPDVTWIVSPTNTWDTI